MFGLLAISLSADAWKTSKITFNYSYFNVLKENEMGELSKKFNFLKYKMDCNSTNFQSFEEGYIHIVNVTPARRYNVIKQSTAGQIMTERFELWGYRKPKIVMKKSTEQLDIAKKYATLLKEERRIRLIFDFRSHLIVGLLIDYSKWLLV